MDCPVKSKSGSIKVEYGSEDEAKGLSNSFDAEWLWLDESMMI